MYTRASTLSIDEALADTPVVLLHGARQTGKTTLAKSIAQARGMTYLTLDESTIYAAAIQDPDGFLAGMSAPVVLDEIQRAPSLFPAIKNAVDRNRAPGRFLLTGSANVLLIPRISESLAGRIQIIPMFPLSQGELEGRHETFVDELFKDKFPPPKVAPAASPKTGVRMVRGGFPEAVSRSDPNRRAAWFDSYLATILQRDVRDIANIEGLAVLPRLVSLLATRVGGLLNFSDIATSTGIPQSTLKRYMALLEAVFLVQLLPAWHTNLGLRLTKSPKLYLCDTGLVSHAIGRSDREIARTDPHFGALLENFVINEIAKQTTWSRVRPRMYHFRADGGHEVDIVLENRSGHIVGIEVKAASSVARKDIKGMYSLAERASSRFVRGIVFYTGDAVVPFQDNIHAVPLQLLWQAGTPVRSTAKRSKRNN